MEIFCTYCSKEKDNLIDLLPAIHRYKSKRIRKIHEAAELLGYPMFILSGEFGLIPTEEKIPYYDHLLLENEVYDLVKKKVINRIKENEISKIFFFLNPSDPFIKPYVDSISQACQISNTLITYVNIDIGEIEDKSIKGYRKIWYASLEANQEMVRNKDITAQAFNELFEKNPKDGMLFYERGEAYESLGYFKKAKNDYELALVYFPNPKWKRVAYQALKRIQKIIGINKNPIKLETRWNYFHCVHNFVYIPHIIRVFVLSALERYDDAEKRLSTGELRICLEMVTTLLLLKYKMIDFSKSQDIQFCRRTNELYSKGFIDYDLKELMITCWNKMSEIIHPFKSEDILEQDYKIAITNFYRILEIINQKRLLPLD